ncbi:MAG: hypothetical protein ACRD2Y_16875, partial [Terriglobales bacterium]
GRAVLAISKALWARDRAALIPHLSEDLRKELGDDVFLLEYQVLVLLAEEVTITSVTETGDEAVVVCESGPADNRSEAELTMVRENGDWKLKGSRQ